MRENPEIQKFIEEHTGKHFCRHCGELIIIKRHHYYRDISEYHVGHAPFSEEHCRKIGKSNKGRKQSEETRKKISDSHKNLEIEKFIEEHTDKHFCKHCGKVIIITKNHYYNGIPKYISGHFSIYEKGKKRPGVKHDKQFKKGCIPWNKGLTNVYSEETRKKMSKSHEGIQSGKNNGMYGKPAPKGAGYGKRSYYDSPLQGKICFRSSYELAYAKYLDENKILWYYEIETFNLGDMTYTPDFFLPQSEKFVEIKGYMSKYSEQKINKFQKQYPWYLEILRKEDLIKIGVKL